MRKFLRALPVYLVAFASPVYAATLQLTPDGQLYGATGVDVGGKLMDVEFIDDSCTNIFSGCDSNADFAFSSLSAAQAASQALLDQVFVNGPLGLFDWRPYETVGISVENNRYQWGYIFTPYRFTDGYVYSAGAHNRSSTDDGLVTTGHFADFDYSTTNDRVFAKWAPSTVSTIPLPAGAPLLLTGIAGFAWLRRRKAKKA